MGAPTLLRYPQVARRKNRAKKGERSGYGLVMAKTKGGRKHLKLSVPGKRGTYFTHFPCREKGGRKKLLVVGKVIFEPLAQIILPLSSAVGQSKTFWPLHTQGR